MKRLLASLLTLCLLAACTNIFPALSTATPTAPDGDLGRLDPDLPMFREGLVTSAQSALASMDGASTYRLDFVIADDFIHVQGKENVRYTNRENMTLSKVDFRLFPNILGGKMTVSNLRIEGMAVTPKYSLADSLMTVPLPIPLEVGKSVYIGMDFELEVPTDVQSNYGVLAYYEGVLTLAHSYPMTAVYNEEGWNAEIPPQSGDVTFADASFFLVTVTAPNGVTVVASGIESAPQTMGNQVVTNVAIGPARDFFLAASRDFQVESKTVGEVTVNSYATKDLQAGSQSALDTAVRALEIFGELYAPYPYTEFDIVITPALALGIEYPGATAIADRLLLGEYGDQTAVYLESTVVHEVAHQWFYNLVGNDQLDQPWLDESLAQFATWQYYETNFGAGAAAGFEQALRARWARVDNALIPIGQPVAAYSGSEYGAIVYGRGAFFFDALKNEMGAESFDAFLKGYTATFSWEIATTERLKSLAEKHCGCDLTPLFNEWVFP